MRAVTLRYALAPACILLAVLLYRSPVGPTFSLAGLFVFAVLAAAWFGGAGPGFAAAILAALAVPQLIKVSYPLLGGFLDVPRFITFSIEGLAVGWWSFRRRQVEAALRESEKRYELAIDASHEGFWDWVPTGDKLYLSPRFREIFGFPQGATFTGRAAMLQSITMPPEDRAALEHTIAEHFAGKTVRLDFEFRVLVDGEVRWVHARGLATRNSSGEVVRWNGAVHDVTARKLAEEALRASEERYSLAMEAAEEGYVDSEVETDQFVTSERLNEIFGIPRGTRFCDRNDFLKHFRFYGDDAKKYHDMIGAVGTPGGPDRYEFEFRIVLSSGEARWIWTRGKVVRDAEGRARRRVGVVADITARKLAEEALRTSEGRFALAVAGSQGGIWEVDFVARTVFFSARTRELCGLPPGPEAVPLDTWAGTLPLHPEDEPRRDAALEAHLSGMAPAYEGEFRLRQADGVYRWRHVRGVCVRDADGKPLRMAGSINDVDARRRAADILRESEQRYERAMDSSDVGYWDWLPAVNKIYASPRLLEIYGFAPGTTFVDRNDLKTRISFHPEDRPAMERAFAEHIAGKTARCDVEMRFTRDGETRWVYLTGMAARDASGAMVRWTGTVRDITERKRSELALRQSEERYELAMAASASGYWDWDAATDRFYVSARGNELFGREPDAGFADRADYLARTPMHPEDLEKWEAARKELFAGKGERLAMELRYVVRGETRWHALQAICKRDDTGKVVRWSGSATDITGRKLAEEGLKTMERKLRQAQRLEAMGTLAGGIAHDFNNILGAILGYGEMAQRGAPKGSRLARDLDNIVIAGERGRALVDRVLAFSRSAVGERVPVHVEGAVREALDLVSAKLPPSVTVHAKLHAGPAAVLGDATQVHQVVANLATNAVQAMPAGGTLRVGLAIELVATPRAAMIGELVAGEYVVLRVADAGAGIAPEIVERIFDPFFTTKEVGTGTGLGLSLVHGIVTELGGAIDVASALGAGSTFTVYLPRSGDAAETPDEDESALPRGDGQRVLVVDDEEPLVQLATRTLEELGYVPTGFTSSVAALAAFRAAPERFDALITDERMPGISGSALIREVRGIRGRLPIVLMSGYVVGAVTSRARGAGAEEVLKKPVSARDLATSLARVLR